MPQNDAKYQEWKNVIATYNRENLQELYTTYLKTFSEEPAPIIWKPDDKNLKESNIVKSLKKLKLENYKQLFQWASDNRGEFWEHAVKTLDIKFSKRYDEVLDLENGVENPSWFKGASLNIVESCFQGRPEQIAVIEGKESSDDLIKINYTELQERVERIAGGLTNLGLRPGDRVVIYAPLSSESIICYLALIKIGLVAVSVADSFSSEELRKRIEISKAKAIITTSTYLYGGKKLSVYEKVKKVTEIPSIVFGEETVLRDTDQLYSQLLTSPPYKGYHYAAPDAAINILFSSGTTKEPKAIPFTQITPIKCASDGHFHQDIQASDVVTWTTGMGWMMAPWLIFASLLNKATIAAYVGAAGCEAYYKFVEDSQITILGTIPSVVRTWKKLDFHKKANWKVRLFSSTGEPSNPEDYFFLMALSGFKAPIIEYCGGTEIGGGYIAGTIVQPASLSLFTTPTLGLDFYLLGSSGLVAGDKEVGETFLIPPSVGMSQILLNKDHHQEYYEGVPKMPTGEILRRHGDAFEQMIYDDLVFYRSVGRTDDAMNLGGIKVSAVEIEEIVNGHAAVFESAAVSVAETGGGLEKLIIFIVPEKEIEEAQVLKSELQKLLNEQLNPLFKITEVKLIDKLPRTTSNKVMRRELRKIFEISRIPAG
jgi:acetyl-CoA synthetase